MENITDWIKYELYPALFERIGLAFPEHNFQPYTGGWRSNTYLSGQEHSRADKTVISKKVPGRIFEQGGMTQSLIDYVMQRDRVEFIDAVKKLAEAAGVKIPKGDFQENFKIDEDRISLWENCNSFFISHLKHTDAKKAMEYLYSRGYLDEDITDMELGYIPSQDSLLEFLKNKGHSPDSLKLNKGIGSTHRLTIPYRSGGSIRGFKFRTIGNDHPKYLNSGGEGLRAKFFNLSGIKGDKNIVIVEGELDSLHATAKGVENVVATGGGHISAVQIKDAVRRGAKSFTLCFDREQGKEEEVVKIINNSIEIIQKEGVNRIYVAALPDLGKPKTDPDNLIKEKGITDFKETIDSAINYYEYQLQETLEKYGRIEAKKKTLHSRDIDGLLDEVIETASHIPDPVDRDRYKKLFVSIDQVKSLGISEESLSLTVERLTTTKNKEAQAKGLKLLLSEVNQFCDKGDTNKALELLQTKVQEVKVIGAKELLPDPVSFATLLDQIGTLPPAYKTGYGSLDKFIGFTPGAITLVAGRPSHGKTTFMLNLLIEMSKLYKDEKFYFFTYEEPAKNIFVKLLNRLIDEDLREHFKKVKDLSKPTNYEFIKYYIREERTDIEKIEAGKRLLGELIDSQRIIVIDINYSVEELSDIIAYLNKKEKLGAVIIDYIQRMRTERRTQDKRTEIAHISDRVLQAAKENGLPIILGSQLNRDAAKSKQALENLKEAGNLEEDANTVISVYCKAREDEEADGKNINTASPVELEIKTLKNREGEVNARENLHWHRQTGVIKEIKVSTL